MLRSRIEWSRSSRLVDDDDFDDDDFDDDFDDDDDFNDDDDDDFNDDDDDDDDEVSRRFTPTAAAQLPSHVLVQVYAYRLFSNHNKSRLHREFSIRLLFSFLLPSHHYLRPLIS